MQLHNNGSHLALWIWFKGRVSRFGACASDNESAVKPFVFGPIRSEYTTPAGYSGQVLQLAGIKIKLTGQCFGHVTERNKKAVRVKHIGIFVAPLHACPMTFKKCQNLWTYANVYSFILVQCAVPENIHTPPPLTEGQWKYRGGGGLIQFNRSTTTSLGTEESGRCGEVAIMGT